MVHLQRLRRLIALPVCARADECGSPDILTTHGGATREGTPPAPPPTDAARAPTPRFLAASGSSPPCCCPPCCARVRTLPMSWAVPQLRSRRVRPVCSAPQCSPARPPATFESVSLRRNARQPRGTERHGVKVARSPWRAALSHAGRASCSSSRVGARAGLVFVEVLRGKCRLARRPVASTHGLL